MPTSEIMNYLSLGCIMSGLDGLFSSLYGVSLHAVEMEPGEAWHYNVHKLVSIMCTLGTCKHNGYIVSCLSYIV